MVAWTAWLLGWWNLVARGLRHLLLVALVTTSATQRPPATVTITLDGNFSGCAASIDGNELALAGAGPAQSATVQLARRGYTLKWQVSGEPGGAYRVSLEGDTESWSREFSLDREGEHRGFKDFTAR